MGFLKIELFEVIKGAGDFAVAAASAFLWVIEEDVLVSCLGFGHGFPL
jgi:hypothetical protein